jgi:hypothetical protein
MLCAQLFEGPTSGFGVLGANLSGKVRRPGGSTQVSRLGYFEGLTVVGYGASNRVVEEFPM